MKILAPVKNLFIGGEIIKTGVGEIYFGVVSDEWQEKYGFKSILNRRDGTLANVGSYKEGKKLIDAARKLGVESYITLNNSPIINDEILIREEIQNCIKIQPDALIVKDIYIAKIIREIDKNIPIHCSSLNQVINSESILFWVENFQISRMIFPRNISVNEIKALCNEFPDLEFEIFIKNDWCYNSDGVCSSLHLEGLKEGIPYVCNREALYKSEDDDFNRKYRELLRGMVDCKVCMLSQLQNIPNLVSLKIVGREKPLEVLLRDIRFLQSALEYLPLADNNKEFMDFNIKNHEKNIYRKCNYQQCEVYNMYYNM